MANRAAALLTAAVVTGAGDALAFRRIPSSVARIGANLLTALVVYRFARREDAPPSVAPVSAAALLDSSANNAKPKLHIVPPAEPEGAAGLATTATEDDGPYTAPVDTGGVGGLDGYGRVDR